MSAGKAPWFVCVSTLFCAIIALSAPALADDAGLKKKLEQGNSEFMESFSSMGMAGSAAMYTTGAIIVSLAGARTQRMSEMA